MKQSRPTEADLIGLIYEAAIDRERWTEVMARLCVYLDSPSGFVWVVDSQNIGCSVAVVHNVPPEPLADYEAHYYTMDPGLAELFRLGEGATVATNQLLTDAEMMRSEYWSDCLRRADALYCIGGNIAQGAERSAAIGIQRHRGAQPFQQRDLDRLSRLLPHLKRAAQIARQLDVGGHAEQVLADFMDGLAHGVVLLDDRGCIAGMNRRGRDLLAMCDGLTEEQGQVTAQHAADRQILRQAIDQVVSTGAGGGVGAGGNLAIRRPSGLPAFQVLVTSMRTDTAALGLLDLERRVCAALVIADVTSHPAVSEAAVQQWFGLTPAESRVALGLAEGCAPEEIAANLNVSPFTVRTQLRSVYGKMGVTRQTQVVRRLLTGPLRFRVTSEAAD